MSAMIGYIPAWQFSQDPANNPNLSPFMPMPTTPGMSGLGYFADSTSSSSALPQVPTATTAGYTINPDGTVTDSTDTPVGTMDDQGNVTMNDGTTIAPDGTTTAADGTTLPTPVVVPAPVSSALPATIQPSQSMQSEIDGFLLNTPSPKASDVVDFLKLYRGHERLCAAQGLVARGLSPHMVMSALRHLGVTGAIPSMLFGFLSLLVASAAGYHGVRRNHGSVGWGALWFVAGGMFPVLTSVVALGQGYAKPRTF